MTFLELCQLTRLECGIQGSNSTPPTVTGQSGLIGRVIGWVADADNFIQTLHPDWNFLWGQFSDETIVGSCYIQPPVDFGSWDRGSFAVGRGTASGMSLPTISYAEWREYNSEKTSSSPYQICVMPNNILALASPADAIYDISADYWKSPTPLTTNEQVSELPERYHRAIVAKAKMWFFEDVESVDQWKQAETEFNSWMEKLQAFSLPNNQNLSLSSPESIVVRPL